MQNKMEQVAAMFGKELGEEFTVVYEAIDGKKYFSKCHFEKMGFIRNGDSAGMLLYMMLRGEVEIVEDSEGDKQC